MQVRCPHCHNGIELVDAAPLVDIECPSCGSHFSLISRETGTDVYGPAGRQSIAHFRLIRLLGTGAFGSVWLAHDQKLDCQVAIKIPRLEQLDASQAEQFFREARAAAQLRHANIVHVREAGRDGDSLYIASDYIEGANLKEWLSGQRLSFRESAELIAKVADALEHAHKQGVVHRDLKPGNILLEPSGEPHITDFGLAKRDSGEITMTLDGQILGTPAYMSPEQAAGRGHHADARSDVYSLGVVLFELLTGELPFRGERNMILLQIGRDESPQPRKLNAKIPRDLETITLKCLQKDPVKRYPTAATLADDLRRWLAGKPILARPIGQTARGWRWCKRNPALASFAAVAVLAFLGGATVSTHYAIEADSRAREAITEKQRADAKADEAQRNADYAHLNEVVARRLLYGAEMSTACRFWESAQLRNTREILNRQISSENSLEFRGWEWRYLNRVCNLDLRTLPGHTHFVPSVAYSPDGHKLASASYDRSIRLWEVATGRELAKLSGHRNEVQSVAFSPDGRLASGSSDWTIKLWNVEARKCLHTFLGHTKWVHSVAFSADGKRLASGSGDKTVKLWDVDTFRQKVSLAGHGAPVDCVAFSPNGETLASASWDKTIILWDVNTGQKLTTISLDGVTAQVHSVTFSPDGKQIASAIGDGTIRFWHVSTGEEIRTLPAHDGAVRCVTFSSDGALLASSSDDETIKLWDVQNGDELAKYRGHEAAVDSVVFSVDRRVLASGSRDGTIKLWDSEAREAYDPNKRRAIPAGVVPSGESLQQMSVEMRRENMERLQRRLRGMFDPPRRCSDLEVRGELNCFPNFINCLVFDSDSRCLVTYEFMNTVTFWDIAKRQESAVLDLPTNGLSTMAISADGLRLATGGRDATIKLWDIETRRELATLEGHKEDVTSVAFCSDGKRLISGSEDDSIKLWDLETGREIASRAGCRKVAFSPNGRRVVSGGYRIIKLWDARDLTELATLKGHASRVISIVFSPDGVQFASGDDDGMIKQWETETGRELATLQGHTNALTGLAFNPTGRRLASCSRDKSIKIWDTETGRESATFLSESDDFRCLAFSHDDRWLAAGRRDSIVLFDTRTLTPDEKMGRFLARGILAAHSEQGDALAEIAKQTHWNDAMREAAIQYVRTANGR